MEQALFKVKSAMQKLDVSRATIYRLVGRGQLEVVKIGTTTRITATSIERLISGKAAN
jgi:excisionase family DNA binding protein